MKYSIAIVTALMLMASCQKINRTIPTRADTVYVNVDRKIIDTMIVVKSCDSIGMYKDSIKLLLSKNDSLTNKLFISNYKVEKVRYYLNICLRNKTQDRFLKGWVRRAIE